MSVIRKHGKKWQVMIRTEVAETSPSTLRIVQQEDPDMKQGIGAIYKPT